jgi:hypothetical protein
LLWQWEHCTSELCSNSKVDKSDNMNLGQW